MHVMLMDYSGEIYAMFTMYQEEGNYNDCIMGSNSTFIVKTKFTNLRRKKIINKKKKNVQQNVAINNIHTILQMYNVSSC